MHGLNKVDVPAVWLVVLLDFFTNIPWHGVAAFCATIYTVLRIVMILRNWKKGGTT